MFDNKIQRVSPKSAVKLGYGGFWLRSQQYIDISEWSEIVHRSLINR